MGNCLQKQKATSSSGAKYQADGSTGGNGTASGEISRPDPLSTSVNGTASKEIRYVPGAKIVRAMYDFAAGTQDDLTFSKGDTMDIVNDDDRDWWLACHLDNNLQGYIPSNYVAIVDTLEANDWYWGYVSKRDAKKQLLLPTNPRGTFLIRERVEPGSYSLLVKDKDDVFKEGENFENTQNVKIYRIRYSDGGGCFITTRKVLPSIHELVKYYQDFADGLCFRLTNPCPRPNQTMWDLKYQVEIDRKQLVLSVKLGAGQFGEVWQGYLHGQGKWNSTIDVAVKVLKTGTVSPKAFLQEAYIIKACWHDKLVYLYAVCSREEPIYIITELMTRGDLVTYLREGEGKTLKLPKLVNMAVQIADGMAYLEQRECIHRDLAARNILVGDDNTVKIAKFGLARLLRDSPDARFSLKWMAPEAALLGKFTIKSDVWSYGISLTEIITHGQIPYPGESGQELLRKVERGYRMPRHPDCPEHIYEVQMQCWASEPESRQTFQYLFEFFIFA